MVLRNHSSIQKNRGKWNMTPKNICKYLLRIFSLTCEIGNGFSYTSCSYKFF